MNGRVRPLVALLACNAAFAACSRDFDVPTQQVPAVIAVTPANGFTEDQIVITGHNLGAGLAQVFFGERSATLVASSTDGSSLTVTVPTQVTSTTVSVVTPAGRVDEANAFTFLGAGHPASQTVGATVALSPSIYTASALVHGNRFAMLDQRYGTLLELGADGTVQPAFLLGGMGLLVFGDDDVPWVYDSDVKKLRHINVPDGSEITTDAIALQVADGGSPDTIPPIASPSGKLFADFVGDNGVAIIDTVARTQQNLNVGAAGDLLTDARFTSDSALVAFTNTSVWRIDLSTTPPRQVEGDAFVDSNTPAAGVTTVSLPASGMGRYAYVRNDGQIGFVDFSVSDPSVAPRLEHDASAHEVAFNPLVPLVDAMTFSADGNHFLTAHTVSGSTISFDCSAPATIPHVVSANSLPGPIALSPITSGPFAGYILAGAQGAHGVAILLPTADVLDTVPYPVLPDYVEVASNGDAVVASGMGVFLVDHKTLQVSPLKLGIKLEGMQSGQPLASSDELKNGAGEPIGWIETEVFEYVPASGNSAAAYQQVVTTAPGTFVVSGGISGDGKWLAVVTQDPFDMSSVTLYPRPGNSAAMQHLSYATPDGNAVQARYNGSNLIVQHPAATGTGWMLSVYGPGGFTEMESTPLPDRPDTTSPYYSPSLGGYVVSALKFDPMTQLVTSLEFSLWKPKALGGDGSAITSQFDTTVGTALALSIDGRLLLSVPIDSFTQNAGLELSNMSESQGSLFIDPQARVALPAQFYGLASTSDGARLYLTLTAADTLAIIE